MCLIFERVYYISIYMCMRRQILLARNYRLFAMVLNDLTLTPLTLYPHTTKIKFEFFICVKKKKRQNDWTRKSAQKIFKKLKINRNKKKKSIAVCE